jgi:hypothetical protein
MKALAMVDLYPRNPSTRFKKFTDYLLEQYPGHDCFFGYMRAEHPAIVHMWLVETTYPAAKADTVKMYFDLVQAGYIEATGNIPITHAVQMNDFTDLRLTRKGYKHFIKKYPLQLLFETYQREHPMFMREYKRKHMAWYKKPFKVWIPKMIGPILSWIEWRLGI